MEHTTKDGRPKLVEKCSYPLTAMKAVSRIYTNLAVLDVTEEGFVVRDLAPGVTMEHLRSVTAAPLQDAKVAA
jgi:3-oxoadipate CoA-transferase beta subunit